MLSRTAEYALRAAVHLASSQDTPQTTRDVAAATLVPTGYLSKVMQSLVEAGLATSQRGLHGGFVLSRPADKISALDVVNAVDPIERIMSCPLNLKSHKKQLCLLHRALDDAIAYVQDAFAGHSLASLSHGTGGIRPLCETGQSPRKATLGPGLEKRTGQRKSKGSQG